MPENKLPLDSVLQGDCVERLAELPPESVDLIFADPPYNLQLQKELRRPNNSKVNGVDEDWDRFDDYAAYDEFTRTWLAACRRVLKPTGTLWVIGSYHNIHRVGTMLQNLDFWILNSVVWVKSNPTPNFRGVRFTNAHEELLWVQKEQGAPYTFNHHAMKQLNEEKQMRSDWVLPIANGHERLRSNGHSAHPTQKPEALLYRVIASSSNPGDVVLDPFFGTGTTGAVAKRLHRRWIGIEQQSDYIKLAKQRIAAIVPGEYEEENYLSHEPRRLPRVPFGRLLESDMLAVGQKLYWGERGRETARVLADGALKYNGRRGSIHQIAKHIQSAPANGWQTWYFEDPKTGERRSIDELRQQIRKMEN
ncbi:MAG: site-specific DNA-methyltransferase [Chloroflexi bacterium]|nr:site-specific DNA-methyltransferase [Chloroflexota bacterium]